MTCLAIMFYTPLLVYTTLYADCLTSRTTVTRRAAIAAFAGSAEQLVSPLQCEARRARAAAPGLPARPSGSRPRRWQPRARRGALVPLNVQDALSSAFCQPSVRVGAVKKKQRKSRKVGGRRIIRLAPPLTI
eukprot:3149449-Pyramimonas_sp.AAC.3